MIKPSHASKILPVDLHITVYNLHYPTDCFPPLSDQYTLEDCGVRCHFATEHGRGAVIGQNVSVKDNLSSLNNVTKQF